MGHALPIRCATIRVSKNSARKSSRETILGMIADNLSKAGWSWGCIAAVDSKGRTIWIVDAHRDDGKGFVVRADE
jgi:hypothetical protein